MGKRRFRNNTRLFKMSKQLTIFDELNYEIPAPPSVAFVDEVEIFNATFGKPNNYEATIPEKKEWKFVYDFILEELEEYKEACERGDIVEVLDALCDIAYVSIGNGTMLHGLKSKIWPAYCEVQASYAIGISKPISIFINTFESEKMALNEIYNIVNKNFDLSPSGLIENLDLLTPNYLKTASYGHFGRETIGFKWEEVKEL